MRSRREKKRLEERDRREKMKARDLFLCDGRCPRTGRYCTSKPYLSKQWLRKHEEGGKCTFPVGIRAVDKAGIMAQEASTRLAADSGPDRLSKGGYQPVESPLGASGASKARCYGKFNRKSKKKAYHKTVKQRAFLDEMFAKRPVVSAKKTSETMRDLKDPEDGGLMFCHAKRGEVKKYAKDSAEYKAWEGCFMCHQKPCTGCNGRALNEIEIKGDFSIQARKRKDGPAVDGDEVRKEEDETDAADGGVAE